MAEDGDRRWVTTMAEAYGRCLVPAVFRPFALDLAERIVSGGDASPSTVLELAAGTGVLTEELVARLPPTTRVEATDLSDAMVEVGRRNVPSASWRAADAMGLPFEDGTVDVVACQFGLMFLPDKVAALREVQRVLRPGGRVVASVWGALADHGYQSAVVAALHGALGEARPRFFDDVVHGYHDPDTIVRDLAAAGLTAPTVERVVLDGPPVAVEDLVVGYVEGTPLRSALLTDGGDATVARVRAAVADELRARLGPEPVQAPMAALVLDARAGR